MLVVVLGGARSGKSRYAERLAVDAGAPVIYVGTAAATDTEMADRIARHQASRPEGWRTVECGDRLDPSLFGARDRDTVLIDGLGVWAGRVMQSLSPLTGTQNAEATRFAPAAVAATEQPISATLQRLLEWSTARRGRTIVVSEEVGWGLVPPYPLGRLFRDILGRANQALAAQADHVYLVVAGIGVDLKRFETGRPPLEDPS
jgi:adenosylcobinamide kinase/adenosylcobinamide-phosphate guanylyltransferase